MFFPICFDIAVSFSEGFKNLCLVKLHKYKFPLKDNECFEE